MMATMTIPIRIADEIRGQSSAIARTPPGTWRMRRRLCTPPPPSPPTTAPTTTIVGHAHLCFCDDGSWFEGHLIDTSDDSQYGLVGKLCSNKEEEENPSTMKYDVSVLDHDAGETYAVQSVSLLATTDELCALTSSSLRFCAQKSFRGQRADMLIQRYLTPRLVGKHLRVYAGQMSVDLAQLENLDSPSEKRMWYN